MGCWQHSSGLTLWFWHHSHRAPSKASSEGEAAGRREVGRGGEGAHSSSVPLSPSGPESSQKGGTGFGGGGGEEGFCAAGHAVVATRDAGWRLQSLHAKASPLPPCLGAAVLQGGAAGAGVAHGARGRTVAVWGSGWQYSASPPPPS